MFQNNLGGPDIRLVQDEIFEGNYVLGACTSLMEVM
jgi:hypothetical protein